MPNRHLILAFGLDAELTNLTEHVSLTNLILQVTKQQQSIQKVFENTLQAAKDITVDSIESNEALNQRIDLHKSNPTPVKDVPTSKCDIGTNTDLQGTGFEVFCWLQTVASSILFNNPYKVNELIIVRKRADLSVEEGEIYEQYEKQLDSTIDTIVNDAIDEIIKEDHIAKDDSPAETETCSEFSMITQSRLSSMPSFSSDVQLSSEFTCSEYQVIRDKRSHKKD